MPKYKATAYIRLSYTDDHSSESDSVSNQRKLIENFVERNPDIEVVSEKIDDGYSGIIFDRPAFKEMMQDVTDGNINCVIVKDLSRLGREYIETGRYLRRVFPAYGVRFIAITDSIDTAHDTLCQTIKDKGDMSPLVVGGSDVWHIGFLYDLCYANDVLESDPDFIEECYKGEKDFSDANYQKAVTDLAEVLSFAQDGWASTPDAQITTFFVNDMSAMMFSGTHMFSQINDAAPDFEYGWFAVPDRDGKVNLLGGGTAGGWALSAEAAKDPDKQAAFDAFCKYFFSSDVYGAYCEAMAAIPTTVETPKMNTSEQFKSVLDALSAADYTHLMWNQEVGNRELPPDFRNFTYKTCIEVAQGSRDVASASSELQKTWNVALQSFNPTTGLGVE